MSEAFFGLGVRDQTLIAVAIDGLYELSEKGPATALPMPKFRDVDGVYLNDSDPNTILVLTNINNRHSVTGALPLFVRRER